MGWGDVWPPDRAAEAANRSAIDNLMIGGNHLASALWQWGDPSKVLDYDQALHAHGQPFADMWVAWKAIRDFKRELDSV